MSQGFPGSSPNPIPPVGGAGSGIPNPYGGGGGAPSGTYSPTYSPSGGGIYGSPGPMPPKSKSGCVVASIVAAIICGGLLLCGGCVIFAFFVADSSYREKARQLSVDYRNDPKVKEEVGDVQEVTYNWGATISREDSQDVYDVRGDKGAAQFVVSEDEDEEIVAVVLQNHRGEWPLPTEAAHAAEHEHAPPEAK